MNLKFIHFLLVPLLMISNSYGLIDYSNKTQLNYEVALCSKYSDEDLNNLKVTDSHEHKQDIRRCRLLDSYLNDIEQNRSDVIKLVGGIAVSVIVFILLYRRHLMKHYNIL